MIIVTEVELFAKSKHRIADMRENSHFKQPLVCCYKEHKAALIKDMCACEYNFHTILSSKDVQNAERVFTRLQVFVGIELIKFSTIKVSYGLNKKLCQI